jgi:hypothetical protein
VLWVEPEDEEALASGIERILTDSELRKTSRGGPLRAARFDWNEDGERHARCLSSGVDL